jgi:hypothetical protein
LGTLYRAGKSRQIKRRQHMGGQHMGGRFIEHHVSFAVRPRSIRVGGAPTLSDILDALGRVQGHVPALYTPGEQDAQDRLQIIAETALAALGSLVPDPHHKRRIEAGECSPGDGPRSKRPLEPLTRHVGVSRWRGR